MRFIWLILGLLFSADGLYCAAVGRMGLGEAVIIAAGIIFILWSVFYDAMRTKKFLKFLKGLFAAFMIILTVYSVGICVFGMFDNATYNEDYVIVLGAGLDGSEPSATLKERLDKTLEYMDRNPDASVIVSGGRGRGESISEADAMYNYLVNNGADDEKILKEENATSTYENFFYSNEAVDSDNVAFITSNFHVLRSYQMAKINGMDAKRIGASTPLITLPAACAREFVAQIAAFRYY